ncbi:MAG: M48 family metalloprotease [Deltaproteobacteria bacterium]|nr:M48 family metalloprotease [Deltaproteobacteria bacterium]
MYNNFIYFLVVLLVFTAYQPTSDSFSPWLAGLGLLVLPGFFWLVVRRQFNRLRQASGSWPQRPGAQEYNRLVFQMSILAIVAFVIQVYLLGLKDLLLAVPGLKASSTLTGLGGLTIFVLYLVILWREAFAVHAVIIGSRISRIEFILNQIRFNLPIALPYLLLSLLTDLIALLPDQKIKIWLSSPLGDMIFAMTFIVVLLVVFPALIKPLWGLKSLEPGPSRDLLENFCRRHDFQYRDITIWPLQGGEGLTAGVMGLIKRWRYIMITPSLLRILDDEELEAVLGHEIGHVKRRHLLLYLVFLLGYLTLVTTWSEFSFYLLLLSDQAVDLWVSTEGRPSTATSLMMGIPIFLLMLIYFRFIFGAFMRNFERQADLYSFKLTGSIRGLVGSLEKIAWHSGSARDTPSWHHYSIAQRVNFLFASSRDPSLVSRHDRKVKLMLAGYLVFIGLTLAGGLAIQHNDWGQNMQRRLMTSFLEAEDRRRPNNPQTLKLIGDAHYESGHLDEAASYYGRALALSPNDPEILNNLAWTLLNRPEADQADKKRAMVLAERAAFLRPVAHILDTLAEALYNNGQFRQALDILRLATERLEPEDDPEHYRKQKEKFENALVKKTEI